MPKVLSLFTGAGGMDLGFEGGFDVPADSVNMEAHPDWVEADRGNGWVRLAETGFKTVFANDIFAPAKAQWDSYFVPRGAPADAYRLESVVDLVKRHRAGEPVFPEAEVVTGGFPCTDFSLSGKRKGFKSEKNHRGEAMDPDAPEIESRGMLYHWMKEVIGIVRPMAFVAENVGGLRSLADVMKVIHSDFSSVGYDVKAQDLYAPDYGVPQTRRRVIFVGLRKDLRFAAYDYPAPTHASPKADCGDLFEELKGKRLPAHTTCRVAFAGLAEPDESEDPSQKALSRARFYGLTKDGESMQGQTETVLDRPGPTIRAEHHGNIEFRRVSLEHGGKNVEELERGLPERRLTVRECARLQTFPDDYQFMLPGVSTTAGYRGVGNAVPPLLAYHIAQSLKAIWPKE